MNCQGCVDNIIQVNTKEVIPANFLRWPCIMPSNNRGQTNVILTRLNSTLGHVTDFHTDLFLRWQGTGVLFLRCRHQNGFVKTLEDIHMALKKIVGTRRIGHTKFRLWLLSCFWAKHASRYVMGIYIHRYEESLRRQTILTQMFSVISLSPNSCPQRDLLSCNTAPFTILTHSEQYHTQNDISMAYFTTIVLTDNER